MRKTSVCQLTLRADRPMRAWAPLPVSLINVMVVGAWPQLSADTRTDNVSATALETRKMKLRSKSETVENICEQSLILFCENFKKDRLEQVRRKYKTKDCLKCVKKAISKKSHCSTPVFHRKVSQKDKVNKDQDLFFNALSPISTRHNTLERIKRENIVKRELFEKSLVAIIAEARKELKKEDKSSMSNDSSNYVNMNANNSLALANNKAKFINNNNDKEFQDYVEDEIYEDILFEQKQKNHIYEPVSFNLYEPIEYK